MQLRKTDETSFAKNEILELLTYENIYSTRKFITPFIDWQTYSLTFAKLNSIDSMNKIEKNAKQKKLIDCLKIFISCLIL